MQPDVVVPVAKCGEIAVQLHEVRDSPLVELQLKQLKATKGVSITFIFISLSSKSESGLGFHGARHLLFPRRPPSLCLGPSHPDLGADALGKPVISQRLALR